MQRSVRLARFVVMSFSLIGSSGLMAEDHSGPLLVGGDISALPVLEQAGGNVPQARVIGVQWWYPESIPVPGVGGWFGGAMAVFDQDGNLLPAAQIMGRVAAGDRPD